MTSTRVISNTSLLYLEQTGNNTNLKGGYRTFCLNTISYFHSDDTIEVPDVLNSPESLQFCGLQTHVANQLYQTWRTYENLGYGPGQGDPVIEYARAYIKSRARTQDGLWESDDWDEALKHQGINEDFRNRILDPNFKRIRLTQSASEWALDTLDSAWEFLDGLDARLQKAKRECDLRSVSPDPSVKPSKAMKPSSSNSLTAALHGGSNSLKLAIETEVPMEVPGRTILYKGGIASRLMSIFNPDGSLDMSKVVSTPPVDFHPTRYDLYFTKQWETATEYAKYAHRRDAWDQPAVMTVAVPNSFLSGALEIFGSDWNDMVWCSRHKKDLIDNGGKLPQKLAHYENTETLIGVICAIGNAQLQKLKSRDEIPILGTGDGVKGFQTVFQGSEMLIKFERECRGFIWVAHLSSPGKGIYFPPSAA